MKLTKILLVAVGIIFASIQFIQPSRNINKKATAADISKLVDTPDDIQVLLQNACYDCHSNYTEYPWYSNIQPVGWFLARHINHGKEELNFSEFGDYSADRQLSKLNEIISNVRDNNMPLFSYKMMHAKANLDQKEKEILINWAGKSMTRLSPKD